MAMRLIRRQATIYSDGKGVVNLARAPIEKAVSPNSMYAGLLLDTWRCPEQRRRVSIKWVPAHRKEKGDEDADTLRDIRGNDLADRLAKEAAKRHPQQTKEMEASIEWYCERAKHVIKALGVAGALFPKAPGDMVRRARGAREAPGSKGGHTWEYRGGGVEMRRLFGVGVGGGLPEGKGQGNLRHVKR